MHSEGQYGVEAGLVLSLRLKNANEGVNDVAGTNNATLNGGANYATVSSRECVSLDGINDYVETAGSIAAIAGDFTVAFWINTTVIGANNFVLNRYTGGDATQLYIEIDSGLAKLELWSGPSGIRYSAAAVNTGSWVHVAFVRSGSAIDAYVNGALSNGSTSGTLTTAVTAGVLTLGKYGASYFAGSLNLFRLYNNRALSAAEIARLARIYSLDTEPPISFAEISDVKASGAASGTFTSGAWRTRDLNTISSDPDSIVVALAANQFTLAAGTYLIMARCPAYFVNSHQARLVDSGGTELLLGHNNYAYQITTTGSAYMVTSNDTFVIGKITLAVQTVLEIQHRCTTTYASVGFGTVSISGNSYVATSVIIGKY